MVIEEKKADMIMRAFEAGMAAFAAVLGATNNPEAQQAAYQAFSRKLTIAGELEAA